jgi:hypothetical protein
MIAVSAQAFSWSTTLDVDAAAMHSLFSALAFPWAWLTPAVPSLELVEASRYFPGGSYEPERLKDWWPFLLAAVTTYGLLPRVLLATLAARRARSARAALGHDHGDARLLNDRLTRSRSGWGTEAAARESAAGDATGAAEFRRLALAGASCDVVVWGDVPIEEQDLRALIDARLGCTVRSLERRWSDVAVARGASEADPIVVVAEAWEAPTRGLCRHLAELRGALGVKRAIVVVLVGEAATGTRAADPSDAEVWRSRLSILGDPYLFVDDGRK